jgi:multidrug efflux pump subunit AcrA (membrane-fusion protein)
MNAYQKQINGLSALIFMAGFMIFLLSACTNHTEEAITDTPSTITPVEVTGIKDSAVNDYIDISAISAYLEKSFVKANINGYVENANIKMGQQVGRGQLLFSLITKEARSIGNTVNKLDPNFKFSGVSALRAGGQGIIVQVNHQKGDYVQDGEAMATISNRNSLVFLLDLPYELNQIITANKNLNIILPDGVILPGVVSGTMPSVDSLAQTQRYIIKVNAKKDIPEGLIAKVRLSKSSHPNAQVLPKSAILSNETADEFWIMKLINDSTAVKVIVQKGIEGTDQVEILKPILSKTDRIIKTGNYGLADTAKIKIQK